MSISTFGEIGAVWRAAGGNCDTFLRNIADNAKVFKYLLFHPGGWGLKGGHRRAVYLVYNTQNSDRSFIFYCEKAQSGRRKRDIKGLLFINNLHVVDKNDGILITVGDPNENIGTKKKELFLTNTTRDTEEDDLFNEYDSDVIGLMQIILRIKNIGNVVEGTQRHKKGEDIPQLQSQTDPSEHDHEEVDLSLKAPFTREEREGEMSSIQGHLHHPQNQTLPLPDGVEGRNTILTSDAVALKAFLQNPRGGGRKKTRKKINKRKSTRRKRKYNLSKTTRYIKKGRGSKKRHKKNKY